MKKIKWKSFDQMIQPHNVKGYEVFFQDAIETYLNENGIESMWWKYYENSIFMEVFIIFENALEEKKEWSGDVRDEMCDVLIMQGLQNLYKKIQHNVEIKVKKEKRDGNVSSN